MLAKVMEKSQKERSLLAGASGILGEGWENIRRG